MRLVIGVLTLAMWCTGCNDLGGNSKPFRQKVLLQAGQEILLDDGKLLLRFSEIQQDSRCPTGVVCVWEGDAAIAVQLKKRIDNTRTESLHTNGAVGNGVVQYLEYRVELKSLTPPPAPNVRVSPDYFVATFLVTAE